MSLSPEKKIVVFSCLLFFALSVLGFYLSGEDKSEQIVTVIVKDHSIGGFEIILEGFSVSEIARQEGLSPSSISCYIRRRNLHEQWSWANLERIKGYN